MLFNIYFEYALKKVRNFINVNEESREIPGETIYADDVDFITTNKNTKERLQHNIKYILEEENLKVNEDKTEKTILERKIKSNTHTCVRKEDLKISIKKNDIEERWRSTKKLGSLLGESEDITRRKQLATAALNKINYIWIRKDKIKQKLRLRLYKTIVKPILMYNSGTWGLTTKEEDNLDAFHRKQVRKVLNVKYPVTMRNNILYKESEENIISLDILKNRWKLFGHTLRLNENTPAQKAMKYYFTKTTKGKFRGRPRITLPRKLNEDIVKYNSGLLHDVKNLKTLEDLIILKDLAKDRNKWKVLTDNIYDTAKAEKNLKYNLTYL